jgi:hypothetical protein
VENERRNGFAVWEAGPKDAHHILQALTTTTPKEVAMATKTIPKTSDRKPQKRINWAKRTRDLIAGAFNGSVLELIDHGITGLEGAPSLSTLIEDEEVKEDRDRFLALLGGIEDRAKNLTEKEHEEICQRTIELEEMYYMRLHMGADKMAEFLLRFYLQTHWNLPSPRRFMASADSSKALTAVGDLDGLGYAIEKIQAVYTELRKNTGLEQLPVSQQVEEGGAA